MKWRGLFLAVVLVALGTAPALAQHVGPWADGSTPPSHLTFSGFPWEFMNGRFELVEAFPGSTVAQYVSDSGIVINYAVADAGGNFGGNWYDTVSQYSAWLGGDGSLTVEALDFDSNSWSFVDYRESVPWAAEYDGGGFGPAYVPPPQSGNVLAALGSALAPYMASAMALVALVVAVRAGLKWTKGISGRAT